MPVVTVGKPLREKLGEDGVDSLVALINESRAEQKNDILEFVEEKFARRLSEEIASLKIELIEKITDLDTKLAKNIADIYTKLSQKIADMDSRLSVKISETITDIIKWMFIFWIGQVGVTLGILFTFFKR